MREGGVADNAAYYVFTHAQDGAFEAHKVKDWFNFTPRINYRTFTAEEAEERFAERARILNHFAVMVNKKLVSSFRPWLGLARWRRQECLADIGIALTMQLEGADLSDLT